MPVKKLLRDLKQALQREREAKRKTQLGLIWSKWKCKGIERRIADLDRELIRRKENRNK